MNERPTNKISRGLRRLAGDVPTRTPRMQRIEHPTRSLDTLSQDFEVKSLKTVTFVVESRSNPSNERGAALVEIQGLDKEGIRRNIPGWAYVSARVGEYHYLETHEDTQTAVTKFEINIPEPIVQLKLVGHVWKKDVDTEIIGSIKMLTDVNGPIEFTETARPLEKRADKYAEKIEVPVGASEIDIRLPVYGGKSDARVPFQIQYFDDDDQLMLPESRMPQHQRYGSIELSEIKASATSIAELTIPVPSKAKTLRIAGVDWSSNTPTILDNANVAFRYNPQSVAQQFLEELQAEDRLVVIDTTAPPVGHATLSLRPNNLAKAWSRLGTKVVFLPFSTIQDQEPRPFRNILQVSRADFDFVKGWLVENRTGDMNTYVCSSYPSHVALTLIDSFNARGWNTVYECRDDMEEFNRVGYSKWYHPQLERRVVEKAGQVTAVSYSLANKLKSLTLTSRGVTVTPNGVNTETIEAGASLRTAAIAENRRTSKVFGYVGHLTDAWFDWDLIISAALKRTEYKFEIIGHGKPDHISLPSNVNYLGAKSHEELPAIVSGWRAGLIPFMDSPLTRSVDPNKIYEYYAWGLPCISAEMGSVRDYPQAIVYSGLDEFLAALDFQTQRTVKESDLSEIEEFLKHCSWDNRALQTSNLFFG